MAANVKTQYSNELNIREAIKTADLIVGAVLIPGAKAPHLITKKMLNTIRENKGVDQNGYNQEDVIKVSGEDRKREEQSFRDIVDGRVDINVFNLYPKAGNAVFGGVIQGMGGMEFQMSLEDTDGLYITCNNTYS